jgi:hypothetical protein
MNSKKNISFTIMAALLILILFAPIWCHAQTVDSTGTGAIDSMAVENLDYHLSKNEFMHFYGTDDTTRALINMFFRKRDFYPSEKRTYHSVSDNICGPSIVIYLTSGLILVVFGIRAAINCSFYTRQQLLYTIIDYENGYEIPEEYARKLRPRDFVY